LQMSHSCVVFISLGGLHLFHFCSTLLQHFREDTPLIWIWEEPISHAKHCYGANYCITIGQEPAFRRLGALSFGLFCCGSHLFCACTCVCCWLEHLLDGVESYSVWKSCFDLCLCFCLRGQCCHCIYVIYIPKYIQYLYLLDSHSSTLQVIRPSSAQPDTYDSIH